MRVNLKVSKRMIVCGFAFLSVLCPITTFAATLGVTNVYNNMLAYTKRYSVDQNENEAEFEAELERLSKEYEQSIKESTTFKLEDKKANSIDIKIAGNGRNESTKLSVKKGNVIRITFIGEKSTDTYKVIIKGG